MAQTNPSPPSPSERPVSAPPSAPESPAVVTPARPRSNVAPAGGLTRVTARADGRVREWQGTGDLADLVGRPGVTLWIDLVDPAPDQVSEVARVLGLHELVAEDIVEGNQRSKVELTDEIVHIVLFALEYNAEILPSEIDIVLGPGYLLTVHEAAWDPRDSHHLRGGIGPILERGPDHLLWALVDALVDGYFPLVDRLGDEIDELQDVVVQRATRQALERLFVLKRDLLSVRRALAPVREIFNQLTNRDLALIDAEEIVYFRDVYDHLIRLTDELDIYRELVSGTLEVYLSQVNNNLSLIMKRLTGVTVVLAGIGAIAGIFGMSEAGVAFAGGEAGGFWLVAALTVAAAAIAAVILRRFDWI